MRDGTFGSMAKEIERKFLVRDDGWKAAVTETLALQQAYIAAMSDRSVRVRIADHKVATLTIKVGTGFSRDEFEYDIPVTDAEELMTAAIGRVISKTRHKVPYQGFVWEVDVFEGSHVGLTVAEVELDEESDVPALPDWLGDEVTGQHRYSNLALATDFKQEDHGLPNSS